MFHLFNEFFSGIFYKKANQKDNFGGDYFYRNYAC